MFANSHFSLVIVLAIFVGAWRTSMSTRINDVPNHIHEEANEGHNQKYYEALWKSIFFFQGQRSGKLPKSQGITWRKDSALEDGHDVGVDLVGGYYDAGDNVKYGFPMAFTTTMLSWSIIEFGDMMGKQLQHALEAVKWGTDYLLKATNNPNEMYVGVGDPYADHDCWERPEDMDTPRTVYSIDSKRPGSEVAAETAAALAAASIVFRMSNQNYSDQLLNRAVRVFKFADTYRGSYNESLGPAVCPLYCDWSGYQDELLWGASWLYKASAKKDKDKHWRYILENIHWLEPNVPSVIGEFGWDNKHGGIYVLLFEDFSKGEHILLTPFQNIAEDVGCTILPESPKKTVSYSPGGLMFKTEGSNMQNPAALSFLLIALARRIPADDDKMSCSSSVVVTPPRLIEVAKSQVDYILGNNPLKMSYMVGYGSKYPLRIHHRGSTLPSITDHPEKITCQGGTPYFQSTEPNSNVLVGAIVGGPDKNDQYNDSRSAFVQSEPTTYINAPMVGVFAYFVAHA